MERKGRIYWLGPLLPFRPAGRRTAQAGRLCYRNNFSNALSLPAVGGRGAARPTSSRCKVGRVTPCAPFHSTRRASANSASQHSANCDNASVLAGSSYLIRSADFQSIRIARIRCGLREFSGKKRNRRDAMNAEIYCGISISAFITSLRFSRLCALVAASPRCAVSLNSIRQAIIGSQMHEHSPVCGLEIRDTADWKSALQPHKLRPILFFS